MKVSDLKVGLAVKFVDTDQPDTRDYFGVIHKLQYQDEDDAVFDADAEIQDYTCKSQGGDGTDEKGVPYRFWFCDAGFLQPMEGQNGTDGTQER